MRIGQGDIIKAADIGRRKFAEIFVVHKVSWAGLIKKKVGVRGRKTLHIFV